MINVSKKPFTLRKAEAEARLKVNEKVIDAIKKGDLPKGDPFCVAKVSAILGAKGTSNIIPYCHPLPVTHTEVKFEIEENEIVAKVFVEAIYCTGVEMEALFGSCVAILTIYDMLKPLKEEMEITGIRLTYKEGGISDFKEDFQNKLKGGILVTSNTVSQGKKEDRSGKIIREHLEKEGVNIVYYKIVPDNKDEIKEILKRWCDEGINIIITSGGTGAGPTDLTVEATKEVIEREVPGIAESMRMYGQRRTQRAMLSRGIAGVRAKSLIINLPGSTKGAEDGMNAILPGVFHIFPIIVGKKHWEEGELK